MNIVIPMAGRGQRFRDAGFKDPKPFIDLYGMPMIKRVQESIGQHTASWQWIFICQEEDMDRTQSIFPFAKVIPVKGITEGAACTVLLAEQYIDNNEELIIANSDQLVGCDDVQNAITFFRKNNAAGGVLTFWNDHPKWSYVGIIDGKINRVAEKQVISNAATVGIYYFAKGKDFVWAAKQMIAKNIRTNNEFYVSVVFNEMIQNGAKILPFWVNEMLGLGTPEDYQKSKEILNA